MYKTICLPMSRADRIRELFQEAVELPAFERPGFLHAAAGDDPSLAAEVASLLAAFDDAEGFLAAAPREQTGDRIGRYLLREPLGEGGFGVVWRAEQVEPLRRDVALKILKPGMDTRQVIARFEIERQTLAWLDHPGIAKVHDAGTTEAGRPYFVMELVAGRPITAFCDDARLGLRERLGLLREVCLAIDHAHRRGVIHRDLKPNNVLVARNEHGHAPKVIDFGIAKATASGATTLRTGAMQVLGTPETMAPEQAAGAGDVDTRADVWGLGVILYELLTGVRPFSGPPYPAADEFELVQRVRTAELIRPSRRVADLPEAQRATVANARQCEPGRLGRRLAGELDWIVARALTRDREHRYASALAFAEDLRRFLEGQPIQACPPSRVYQLRKFVVRHSMALTLLGLAITGLAGGLLTAARGWSDAVRAHEHTERVLGLTVKMLATTDPHTRRDADWTVREYLDEFARAIDQEVDLEPPVEARLRSTLGSAYRALGLPAPAEPHLARALELRRDAPVASEMEHRDLATSLWDWGWLQHDRGAWGDAEQLMREALAHGEAAGELGRRFRGETLTALGDILRHQGKLDEAEACFASAFAVLEPMAEHAGPPLAVARNGQGMVMMARRRFPDAESLFRRAIDELRRSPPDGGLALASALTNFASSLRAQRRAAEGEAPMREAAEIRRRIHGAEHPLYARALASLAAMVLDQKRFDEAQGLLDDAVAVLDGRRSPECEIARATLAQVQTQLEAARKREEEGK